MTRRPKRSRAARWVAILFVLGLLAWMVWRLFVVAQAVTATDAAVIEAPARDDGPAMVLPRAAVEPERLAATTAGAEGVPAAASSPAAAPAEAPEPEGPVLTLRAVDELDAAVPGVTVHVEDRPRDRFATDAAGRARIPVEPATSPHLLLVHPRFLLERPVVTVPDERALAAAGPEALRHTVVLRRGARACLAVVDARGEPIEGALVRVRDDTGGGTFVGRPEYRELYENSIRFGGTDLREARAGPDGLACLEALRPGHYQLAAAAAGFVEGHRRDVVVAAGVNDLGVITLRDAVRLTGRVLAPSGPVADARVEILADGTYATVTTGGDGRFLVDTLERYPPAGDLVVRHEAHDTLCETGLELGPAPLEITLRPRRTAHLVLLEATGGAPVEGEVTVERGYAGSPFILATGPRRTHELQQGELAVDDLASCLAGVDLSLAGRDRTWVPRETLEQAVDAPVTIVLGSEALLVLAVTDLATGRPLTEAGLTLRTERPGSDGQPNHSFTYLPLGGADYDPGLGGYPFDARQLHVGSEADGVTGVAVWVRAEGHRTAGPLELARDGVLLQAGVLPVALEATDG